MVDISVNDNSNSVDINVNTPQEDINLNVAGQSSMTGLDAGGDKAYSDLAREWAIKMNGKVLGEDHSSKYYAAQAKQSEEIVSSAIGNIEQVKGEAIEEIGNVENSALANINTTTQTIITEIENTASDIETDLNALTTRAETATNNAENSATNAEISETNAQTHASSAQNSANDANTSAINANNSAIDAANSANNASISEANASNFATFANSSATQAAASASLTGTYANSASDSADNAEIWAEGTDEQVQALGGTHSSKGWVDYVLENAPTATVTQTESGATLTVTDINGTTTANISNGAKGDKGDTGEQGIQGPQGEQGIQGIQGVKGDTGDAFAIFKTYASVSVMNTDKNNVAEGKFVLITSDVEDPDNAKLYVKGASDFTFLTDMSGATGIQGPQGEQGIQGVQGEQGIQGIQGEQGIQGATGPQGETGTSVTGVELISTVGLDKTYRMSFSDGTHFDYVVSNGASGVSIDNETITTNSSDELQAVGVIDNNSGNALRSWTGTLAQYNAIGTKDPLTTYFITDDSVDETDTVLSQKANIDFSNIDNAALNLIAHESMPSSNFEQLVLSTSGEFYTAPANGYFMAEVNPNTTSQYWLYFHKSNGLSVSAHMATLGLPTSIILPCTKGDRVQYSWRFDGTYTAHKLYFYYANGSNINEVVNVEYPV